MIYIPNEDYVQRADDEGRDFHPYRTIHAAAAQWVGTGHQWEHFGTDEDYTLAFAERTEDDVRLSIVRPDDDMEGLYPAASLPFTIKPYPFAVDDLIRRTDGTHTPYRVTGYREGKWINLAGGPRGYTRIGYGEFTSWEKAPTPDWHEGDYIALSGGRGGTTWRVLGRTDSGWEGWKVQYLTGPHAPGPGVISDSTTHMYVKVDAPTVTYTVTVRADYSTDDVQDALVSGSMLDCAVQVVAE